MGSFGLRLSSQGSLRIWGYFCSSSILSYNTNVWTPTKMKLFSKRLQQDFGMLSICSGLSFYRSKYFFKIASVSSGASA